MNSNLSPDPRQARMWRKISICAAALLAVGSVPTALARTPATTPAQPNFVLLVLDDLGYSDLGCYGGEIRTPNIDSLASDGLRFRSFYNASRCCPTRASLLTGLYPHQVGLAHNGRDLSQDAATVAESLRGSGYQTAMAGKWHLSSTTPINGNDRGKEHLDWLNHQADYDRDFANPATYPINRGFERHYGPIWGVVDYFDPFSLVDGTEPVKNVTDDFYMTDAISAKSVEYIDTMSKTDKPFFLYVAETAPHWPLHARPEDIARYKGQYDQGWHSLREERYQRQVKLGLIDPKTHPLPSLMGRGPDWDDLPVEERKHQAELMEVHAAMVDRVDQGVGKIIQALKAANQFDNTVFMVLADNGASPERYLQYGFDRSSETREGQPIQYRGTFRPGSETTWGYIGAYWANALNTPYRYWKVEAFEGGCHTPMIVHWPQGLKTSTGSFTDQTGHVIDLTPTCLDLAGLTAPKELNGHNLKPIEGKSLAPIFKAQTRDGHKNLYFEHEGGRALLSGDGWKLVASAGKPWELYNVAVDATETHNLAERESERVDAMNQLWVKWADRVGADVPAHLRRSASQKQLIPGQPMELQTGLILSGADAPLIAKTPFLVEVTVLDAGKGGVIFSQGAQVQGWSLFVRDQHPVFAVRRDGQLHEIVGKTTLGADETKLAAELFGDGRMSLLANGVEVATGQSDGLISSQPNDPLVVGDDKMGSVGTYPTPSPFGGKVLKATLTIMAPENR